MCRRKWTRPSGPLDSPGSPAEPPCAPDLGPSKPLPEYFRVSKRDKRSLGARVGGLLTAAAGALQEKLSLTGEIYNGEGKGDGAKVTHYIFHD